MNFVYSEDVNKQLDGIQGDLDSLKELFQADNDYSLDANALFGVCKQHIVLMNFRSGKVSKFILFGAVVACLC